MEYDIRGVKIQVSAEDFEWVSKTNWTISRQPTGRIYIQHWKKGKCKYIHRMITNAPKGKYVDHINRDTLDNRRENLRVGGQADNARNTPLRKSNRSGYRGVYQETDGRKKKWKVEVTTPEGKHKWICACYDKAEAGAKWDEYMVKAYPDFKDFNFPDDIV